MPGCALPSAAANDPAETYEPRNVTVGAGGFAPNIVFSRAEPDLAYLRTGMGGAYRWDARQGRWLPLQDGNPVISYMGIESIAADPANAGVVYLAAGMGRWGEASSISRLTAAACFTAIPPPATQNED